MRYDLRDLAFFLNPWKLSMRLPHRERRIKTLAPISDLQEYSNTDDILFFALADTIAVILAERSDINLITCAEDANLIDATRFPELNYILVQGVPELSRVCAQLMEHIVKGSQINISAVLLEALSANSQKGGTMIATIERLFGNPVAILDSGLDLIVASQPDCIALMYGPQNAQTDYTHVISLLEAARSACFLTSTTGRRLIVAPACVAGVRSGYVCVLEDGVSFTESDLTLADTVSKAAAIEMQKSDIYRFETGFRYEDFLVKLIENKDRTRQFIDAMAKNQALSIAGNLFIASFQIPELYQDNKFLRKSLAHELRLMLSGSLSAIYQGHAVVLFTARAEAPLTPSVRQQIEDYLAQRHLVGGISQKFTDLADTRKYHQQSLEAISLSRLLKRSGNLFLMQDLILYEMFSNLSTQKDMSDYIDPRVVALMAYDRQYATQYLETLIAMIQNSNHVKETACALHIHRNTLFYRLNKMKEISALDLDRADDLFRIQLSLHILEFTGGLK